MDNKPTSPKRSISRCYGASLTVGLIGLALSLTAFFSVREWETKLQELDFDRLAEARCELFDREVIGSISKLTALKQFFDGSQFVDRREFTTFINPLHEISTHKLAFFWAPQVLEANRRSFEKAALAEGISDFSIHCDSPVDGIAAVTQRERYYPVLYYCHESNWAMGLDLLREPHLRKAIKQAVDTDQPVVTGSILFPGKQQDWSGVAVLQAVYHKGLPTTTVEERRCAIEGVVVCAMQLGEILEDVIQTLTPVGIDIQVADLSTPEGKQILYQYSARLQSGDTGDTLNETSDASGLIYATTFDVAGHTWDMHCTPSSGYLAAHPLWTHWIILLGGLILTALLVIHFYMVGNRTAIVEAIVDERTAQLRASEDSLAQAQALAHVGSWKWEFEDNRVTWSEETYRIFGLDPVDCAGNIETICWEAVHPDDKARVFEAREACVANQEFHPIEYRIIRPDGEIRHVHTASKMLYDSDGIAIGIAGSIQDITEPKQAERKLQESENKFRSITETAEDSIFIKDRNLRYTMVNPAMGKLFGVPVSQIIGKTDSELFGEEAGAYVREVDTRVLNGEILREEHTKPVNKVPFTFNVVKVPMRDNEGNILGLCGIARDVTERKRTEETLKQSAKNYRDLFNNATDAIYIQDKEGRFLDVNQGAVDMYGYPKECFIGKTPEFLSAPGKNDLKKIIGFVEDAFNGKPRQYDFWGIRKSGEVFPKIVRSQRGFYQGRKVIITFALDITERKRAESVLQMERDKLTAIFESMEDGVYIVNKDHDIEYVNPVLKKEFGSPEGKKCHKYFHGSDEPCTFCRNEEVLAGKTVHWEWTSPKNGKTYDLIDTPFKNADGSISKLEMFRDITEILRLRELETRAQRLESAGSIAGQVAHDFNNLLGPLMAYPELIREELPEDHKVLTFLSSIETAAEQMADINQDLLTMGRRGHYNMKPMNMNEVVLQAVKELKPLPETLVCETNLAEDLMNILGGPSQVYRAVANILHNARDAMQDIGTITINTENYYADDVTIAYNRVPRGEYVKLTISDTGSGIPADIVEKIFEPFFTSKATDKKRGSGLGMSVVDAVIKDHKGYIDLSTKVGEGTSFYLYFPVTRETIEAQETDQIAGGCETVLVVDDDDIQRDIVRSLLQKLGYEVSVVESGEKAIKFLRNNPQDLLILDMIMPSGMDGADTYTKVVEIYPQQKAIVVSGYSETESVQKVQSLGAGAFIKKPVTLHKIAGAVRKELDREVGVAV